MKFLCFAVLTLFVSPAVQADELLTLRSNKAEYAAGENAILRATLATKPADENYELDIVSTLNDEPLSLQRTTDYEMFTSVATIAAGEHTWVATVVVQDKRYARDLKASIGYFDEKIEDLDAQIAEETDPDTIANLTRRRTRYVDLKADAISELANHRTAVAGPITHTFTAL